MKGDGKEFHPGNGTVLFVGEKKEDLSFARESAQTLDFGMDFYAPQTIQTCDGRRVMIGWMQNWDTCNVGHGETEPAVHGDLLPFLQVIEDASPRADDIIERGCPLVAALLVARQCEGDELALGSLPGVGPHHGVRGDVADKEDVLHDGLFLMVGKYVWSVLVIGTQEGHSLDKGIVRGA